nr:MAG TPA: hypothetical protein [Caudoviricetes sp.]
MPGPARWRVAGTGAPKREKVGAQADGVPGRPRRHVG